MFLLTLLTYSQQWPPAAQLIVVKCCKRSPQYGLKDIVCHFCAPLLRP